ncbi:MAG: FG-GAP-like repeat-containing protein, partial [Hyphomicrobiales bacterium]|nr:FG-GAP-like repeat-containing protein [Hyphomicrobiales bacterium]
MIRPFEKRFVLALVLVAVLAAQFWTQSRYPSLDDKAIMSGAIQLEDPLSFEAVLPIRPEFPVWKKIAYTTVNWLETNERGMTFGVLFAAAFLTLLGYLRRQSFSGAFSNSLLGMGIGAPLGVCVNCAAPIAKALYTGGVRAEATLSAMIASPTLNIVVLTMLFSILPFYMAVTKIALSLLMILAAVPVICRFLPSHQLQVAAADRIPVRLPRATQWDVSESLFEAMYRFAGDFAANLWFIVTRTVPLMFLAGFLGAVIATLLPADLLSRAEFGIVSVMIAAIVGTILPVPIGFDVVASGALLGSGLDTGYVMVLLFTLGIFSIYSFFIIAGAISMRAAVLVGIVVIVLGGLSGIGVHHYHGYLQKRALELLTGFHFGMVSGAHAAQAVPFYTGTDGQDTIKIVRRPFNKRSPAGKKPFTRIEAWRLGIDRPIEFSFADMWPPFWEGRSISAGDFDNDGDADLVFASTVKGLYFYANDGAGHFTPVDFPLGPIAGMPVFNAALVDIDNDGWLDLFLTTYQEGNHVLKNVNGRFDAADLAAVANREDAILSLAASFGDVDGDGDLDLALGNWAAGWYRRIPGEESRNRIIFNDSGVLDGSKFRELPGIPGETLSMLLSDIDLDGNLDLLEGNDFEMPDEFYYGEGGGGFNRISRQDKLIPMTTTTTMSIKTADLNNRGAPDIYIAQIAGRSSGVSKRLKMRSLDFYCSDIERQAEKAVCAQNMAIKAWYKSGHSFDPSFAGKCQELDGRYGEECKGMLVKDLAIQNKDPALCALIPAGQKRARQYCDIHFRKIRQPSAAEIQDSIPQILGRNVLLTPRGDGTYAESAVEAGLEIGGWSWDVKIADVDNDGWKDVYVVNGTWVPNEVSPSNLF